MIFQTGALPSGLFVLDRPGTDADSLDDQAVGTGGGANSTGGFPTNSSAGPSTGDSTVIVQDGKIFIPC